MQLELTKKTPLSQIHDRWGTGRLVSKIYGQGG
jgi:hypothetical protein